MDDRVHRATSDPTLRDEQVRAKTTPFEVQGVASIGLFANLRKKNQPIQLPDAQSLEGHLGLGDKLANPA